MPPDGRVRPRALPTLPYTSARGPAATRPIAQAAQRYTDAGPSGGEPDERGDVASAAMPGVRPSDYAGCSLVRLVQMAGQSLAPVHSITRNHAHVRRRDEREVMG